MSQQGVKRDTGAWILQSWAFFALSLGLSTGGILYLPVELWVRGAMGMGIFFSVSSTFTLSKTIRDNQEMQVDTGAWMFQVWAAFVISVTLMGFGIYHLPVDNLWTRAFMAAAFFFTLGSCFTLAKTIRDRDEANKALVASGEVKSAGV